MAPEQGKRDVTKDLQDRTDPIPTDKLLIVNGATKQVQQLELGKVEDNVEAKIQDNFYRKTQTYNKSELDAINQQTLGAITSGFRGSIAPTDPAPTLDGVYKPEIDAIYTNLGFIEVNRSEGGVDYGKSVEIVKKGSTFVKVSEQMPKADNKIPKWTAQPYTAGKQVLENDVWYEAVVNTTAAQRPGVVAETIWKRASKVNIPKLTPILTEGDVKRIDNNTLFIAKKSNPTDLPITDITAFNKIRTSPRGVINAEGYFGKP